MSQAILDFLMEGRGRIVSDSFTRPNDTTAYAAGDVVGTAYVAATCTVHSATAGDNLTVSAAATLGTTANSLKILLTTAAEDTLAVTKTDGTKTINIALAKTTAAKNTAALIQTAIRALSTVGGIDVSAVTCTAVANWDTTAIATGETAAVSFSGGVDPECLTFAAVLPDLEIANVERLFLLLGARLRADAATIPSGMAGFRLHLYNAVPSLLADNAAFNLPVADRAKYLGFVTLSAPLDLGDTLVACDDNLNFTGMTAAGSTTLYGYLQTLGAYTPTASVVKTVSLSFAGV